MDFGDVLKAIRRDGLAVRRPRWQEGQALGILSFPPLEDGRLTLVFSDGEYTPWVPSNADLLAEDWLVAETWITQQHMTRQDVTLLQQVPFCPHCLSPADGNVLIVQVA